MDKDERFQAGNRNRDNEDCTSKKRNLRQTSADDDILKLDPINTSYNFNNNSVQSNNNNKWFNKRQRYNNNKNNNNNNNNKYSNKNNYNNYNNNNSNYNNSNYNNNYNNNNSNNYNNNKFTNNSAYKKRIIELQGRLIQKDIRIRETELSVMKRQQELADYRIEKEKEMLEIEKDFNRKFKDMQQKENDLLYKHEKEVTQLNLIIEGKREIITKLREELDELQKDVHVTRTILESVNIRNMELTGQINEMAEERKKLRHHKRIQTKEVGRSSVEIQTDIKVDYEACKRVRVLDVSMESPSFSRPETQYSVSSLDSIGNPECSSDELRKIEYKNSQNDNENMKLNIDGTKSDDYVMMGKNSREILENEFKKFNDFLIENSKNCENENFTKSNSNSEESFRKNSFNDPTTEPTEGSTVKSLETAKKNSEIFEEDASNLEENLKILHKVDTNLKETKEKLETTESLIISVDHNLKHKEFSELTEKSAQIIKSNLKTSQNSELSTKPVNSNLKSPGNLKLSAQIINSNLESQENTQTATISPQISFSTLNKLENSELIKNSIDSQKNCVKDLKIVEEITDDPLVCKEIALEETHLSTDSKKSEPSTKSTEYSNVRCTQNSDFPISFHEENVKSNEISEEMNKISQDIKEISLKESKSLDSHPKNNENSERPAKDSDFKQESSKKSSKNSQEQNEKSIFIDLTIEIPKNSSKSTENSKNSHDLLKIDKDSSRGYPNRRKSIHIAHELKRSTSKHTSYDTRELVPNKIDDEIYTKRHESYSKSMNIKERSNRLRRNRCSQEINPERSSKYLENMQKYRKYSYERVKSRSKSENIQYINKLSHKTTRLNPKDKYNDILSGNLKDLLRKRKDLVRKIKNYTEPVEDTQKTTSEAEEIVKVSQETLEITKDPTSETKSLKECFKSPENPSESKNSSGFSQNFRAIEDSSESQRPPSVVSMMSELQDILNLSDISNGENSNTELIVSDEKFVEHAKVAKEKYMQNRITRESLQPPLEPCYNIEDQAKDPDQFKIMASNIPETSKSDDIYQQSGEIIQNVKRERSVEICDVITNVETATKNIQSSFDKGDDENISIKDKIYDYKHQTENEEMLCENDKPLINTMDSNGRLLHLMHESSPKTIENEGIGSKIEEKSREIDEIPNNTTEILDVTDNERIAVIKSQKHSKIIKSLQKDVGNEGIGRKNEEKSWKIDAISTEIVDLTDNGQKTVLISEKPSITIENLEKIVENYGVGHKNEEKLCKTSFNTVDSIDLPEKISKILTTHQTSSKTLENLDKIFINNVISLKSDEKSCKSDEISKDIIEIIDLTNEAQKPITSAGESSISVHVANEIEENYKNFKVKEKFSKNEEVAKNITTLTEDSAKKVQNMVQKDKKLTVISKENTKSDKVVRKKEKIDPKAQINIVNISEKERDLIARMHNICIESIGSTNTAKSSEKIEESEEVIRVTEEKSDGNIKVGKNTPNVIEVEEIIVREKDEIIKTNEMEEFSINIDNEIEVSSAGIQNAIIICEEYSKSVCKIMKTVGIVHKNEENFTKNSESRKSPVSLWKTGPEMNRNDRIINNTINLRDMEEDLSEIISNPVITTEIFSKPVNKIENNKGIVSENKEKSSNNETTDEIISITKNEGEIALEIKNMATEFPKPVDNKPKIENEKNIQKIRENSSLIPEIHKDLGNLSNKETNAIELAEKVTGSSEKYTKPMKYIENIEENDRIVRKNKENENEICIVGVKLKNKPNTSENQVNSSIKLRSNNNIMTSNTKTLENFDGIIGNPYINLENNVDTLETIYHNSRIVQELVKPGKNVENTPKFDHQISICSTMNGEKDFHSKKLEETGKKMVQNENYFSDDDEHPIKILEDINKTIQMLEVDSDKEKFLDNGEENFSKNSSKEMKNLIASEKSANIEQELFYKSQNSGENEKDSSKDIQIKSNLLENQKAMRNFSELDSRNSTEMAENSLKTCDKLQKLVNELEIDIENAELCENVSEMDINNRKIELLGNISIEIPKDSSINDKKSGIFSKNSYYLKDHSTFVISPQSNIKFKNSEHCPKYGHSSYIASYESFLSVFGKSREKLNRNYTRIISKDVDQPQNKKNSKIIYLDPENNEKDTGMSEINTNRNQKLIKSHEDLQEKVYKIQENSSNSSILEELLSKNRKIEEKQEDLFKKSEISGTNLLISMAIRDNQENPDEKCRENSSEVIQNTISIQHVKNITENSLNSVEKSPEIHEKTFQNGNKEKVSKITGETLGNCNLLLKNHQNTSLNNSFNKNNQNKTKNSENLKTSTKCTENIEKFSKICNQFREKFLESSDLHESTTESSNLSANATKISSSITFDPCDHPKELPKFKKVEITNKLPPNMEFYFKNGQPEEEIEKYIISDENSHISENDQQVSVNENHDDQVESGFNELGSLDPQKATSLGIDQTKMQDASSKILSGIEKRSGRLGKILKNINKSIKNEFEELTNEDLAENYSNSGKNSLKSYEKGKELLESRESLLKSSANFVKSSQITHEVPKSLFKIDESLGKSDKFCLIKSNTGENSTKTDNVEQKTYEVYISNENDESSHKNIEISSKTVEKSTKIGENLEGNKIFSINLENSNKKVGEKSSTNEENESLRKSDESNKFSLQTTESSSKTNEDTSKISEKLSKLDTSLQKPSKNIESLSKSMENSSKICEKSPSEKENSLKIHKDSQKVLESSSNLGTNLIKCQKNSSNFQENQQKSNEKLENSSKNQETSTRSHQNIHPEDNPIRIYSSESPNKRKRTLEDTKSTERPSKISRSPQKYENDSNSSRSSDRSRSQHENSWRNDHPQTRSSHIRTRSQNRSPNSQNLMKRSQSTYDSNRNSSRDETSRGRSRSPVERRDVNRSISLNSSSSYQMPSRSPNYSRYNSYQGSPHGSNSGSYGHSKSTHRLMPSLSPSPPPLVIDDFNQSRQQNKKEISKIVIGELTVFYEMGKFESDNKKELFKGMARAITHHFYEKDPDRVADKTEIKNYVMEIFFNYGTISSDRDFLLADDYNDF